MKKLVKYQLSDCKYAILVYYLVMIGVSVFANIQVYVSSTVSVNTGNEFSSGIMCFILGICVFKEHYWMAAQNGFSRRTYFKSYVCLSIILSFILSAIDFILLLIQKLLTNAGSKYEMQTFIEFIYNDFSKDKNIFLILILSFIFSIIIFTALFLSGYLISILFYRSGKIMKIFIAAGIPIFAVMVLPFLALYFSGFFEKIIYFIFIIMGVISQNPLFGIISTTIIAIIILGFNYLAIRRAVI